MSLQNVLLIFQREVSDQLRDRRTLFMVLILPMLLYPALGIGMVQMTILFSEQPRTVVILGADELPAPPLLVDGQIAEKWFNVPDHASKLKIITDSVSTSRTEAEARILEQAVKLREKIDRVRKPKSQEPAAERNEPVVQSQIVDGKAPASREAAMVELATQLNDSNIQVLLVFPEGLREHVASLASKSVPAAEAAFPRPVMLANKANEKSALALGRISQALVNWERAVLSSKLESIGLPKDLPTPIRVETIDLAVEEQISANMWSKLFPALLILMSVTGAFYPAVDLAAGEKERGTMETLLICPATRTEIVLGKFLTVMCFSVTTAILNLGSLGFTGRHMVSLAGANSMSKLGDLTPPPWSALVWVLIVLIPMAALFSALCLALATFARSSKEGQYYLTPLLMLTLGLTMFCLSPAVEMQPFYSVMPVMGPALLLKGLLLAANQGGDLYVYIPPVLMSSLGYAFLALWWAIDQFGNEEVLFRESERFDLKLWIRHLLRRKDETPTFGEAGFCVVMIMLLQFMAIRTLQDALVRTESKDLMMLQLIMIQQLVIVASPALFMGVLLTANPRKTFSLYFPRIRDVLAAVTLAVTLQPVARALLGLLHNFFPPLPPVIVEQMKVMTSDSTPTALLILAFAIAPGICEEIAYRGFILSGFRRSGRIPLTIVLSSLAFGIVHMIPQQVFNATLLGLVLGMICIKSRSIIPSMAFHITFNSIELLSHRYGQLLPTEGYFSRLWTYGPEHGLVFTWSFTTFCAAVAGCLIYWFLKGKRFSAQESPAAEISLVERKAANPTG